MVVALIGALHALRAAGQENPKAPQPVPTRATVEKALAARTAMEFVETPLQDVAAYLGDLHKLHVVIDKNALNEAGMGSETPVTCNLHDLSLASGLNLILGELGLHWIVRDGYLLITTADKAESLHERHVYNVRDLLMAKNEAGALEEQPEQLEAYLRETVLSGSHLDPSLAPLAVTRGMLVLATTQKRHRDTAALLAATTALRERQRRSTEGMPAAQRFKPIWLHQTPRDEKTRQTLLEETHMQFIETPLSDVRDYLEDLHRQNIALFRKALDDAAISTESPITAALVGLPLGVGLPLILEPLGLTYVVENEVLVITTLDDAGQRLAHVVYPVADLIDPAEHGSASAGYQQLIDTIKATVYPETWIDVGGPGSAAALPSAGVLAVSASQRVQLAIENVLADLREARRQIEAAGPVPQADWAATGTLFLRKYPLERVRRCLPQERLTSVSEKLAQTIPTVVQPETWFPSGGKGQIHALPGLLLVRQTAAVHKELRQFLKEVEPYLVSHDDPSGSGQGAAPTPIVPPKPPFDPAPPELPPADGSAPEQGPFPPPAIIPGTLPPGLGGAVSPPPVPPRGS
jgi:hypothetical protein